VAHLGTRGYDATLLPYEGVGHQISDAMRQRVSEELRRALDTAPPSP
jgi:hypothetical protein